MGLVDTYEWAKIQADDRDPNAGGASHLYDVRATDGRLFAWVQFQRGPRDELGSEPGCLDDHVLAIVYDRLAAFQEGPYPCEENDIALTHIRVARRALCERAEKRRARGVLGKNLP